MKHTLKIIAEVLIGAVLLTNLWCFAYPRLFPERMKAAQAAYQDWLQKED